MRGRRAKDSCRRNGTGLQGWRWRDREEKGQPGFATATKFGSKVNQNEIFFECAWLLSVKKSLNNVLLLVLWLQFLTYIQRKK
jgi:hypothetical protein